MSDLMRLKYAELFWMIETYHRGVKQFCGIERCQARSENAQRNYWQYGLFSALNIIVLSKEFLGLRQRLPLSVTLFGRI
jgi:hypothetical protein